MVATIYADPATGLPAIKNGAEYAWSRITAGATVGAGSCPGVTRAVLMLCVDVPAVPAAVTSTVVPNNHVVDIGEVARLFAVSINRGLLALQHAGDEFSQHRRIL